MTLWLQFAALAGVIVFAGSNLSRYGDVIAEKTGMGRTWVGVVLMAAVTSLPELISGVSAVAIFDLPNLAIGNILGACAFNMLTIALLDVLSGSTPISARVHQGQVLAAGFAVLLLALASMSIASAGSMPALGWIGWYSAAFLLVYIIAMRTVLLFEKRRIAEFVHEKAAAARYGSIALSKAYRNYAINAALVIAAAVYLPDLGDQIAKATGLGSTFVGTTFVALTTTLPELVVSIAALRIDAADLVYGNLFGSNLFNMAILALDDLLYFDGPLLVAATPGHVVTANAAMAMTAIAMIGLTYRASKKRFLFAWDSLGIVTVYLYALSIVYMLH